ncbi:tryptophan-rich sensory protein [Aureibaculum sp. 2210JD6-5]|uniref:tryptophan-rich sensory protein n=1 Tax=Aureibaculum sp. 2210JD6-5 TaxID=3103957 RepID=UPI002AAE266E|nr:tryptophan-rich sensory protein [Aureibaculum sp. 2210JD6-5]MDY7393759.1 tryptophan-rich sensory protein [Aureibaculum sp. 2210JD6-5]
MDSLKKQQTFSIINSLSVLIAIGVNYYSQVYKINGNTVGRLSDEYANLFTPAGYAFSIWGLIYLGLIVFSTFQIYQTFKLKKKVDFIVQTNYWFALTNLANAAWIIAWLNEYTLLSVLIMFVMLFSLVKIILNTNMERWDAPKKIIAFYWWPICLYSGWIAVATIANVSAYLAKIEWTRLGLSEIQWTIIMILIATFLNIIMIYKRNMREFAAIGVWALLAIFVRHQSEYQNIAYTALSGAIILLVFIMYHGFKNRKMNPFFPK